MMLKTVTILFLMIVLSSCSGGRDSQSNSLQTYDYIIDVRSASEYEAGHLENAINIPHTLIKEEISMHVKELDATVLLYCRSGRRSGLAQDALSEMGYQNVVNGGGYESLK